MTQLKIRLGALLVLLAAAMAMLAFLAARRLEATTAAIDTVFNDRVVCLQQLHEVSVSFGESIPSAFRKVRAGALGRPDAQGLVASARETAKREWRAYRQTRLTETEARLASAVDALLGKADPEAARGQELLAHGTAQELDAFSGGDFRQTVDSLTAALDGLVALQVEVSRQQVRASRAAFKRSVQLLSLLAMTVVALGSALTWTIFRRYASETSLHEARLARLNSFYVARSRTNQLIVKEPDEATLLADICRICVDAGHAHLSSIHVLDGTTVHRVATAGESLAFYDGLPASWELTPPTR